MNYSKVFFVLCASFLSLSLFAQYDDPQSSGSSAIDGTVNFKVDGESILWQKVFETPLDFQQLTEKVKDLGIVKDLETRDNKLSGDLNAIDFDFKGAGFKRMNTPIYFISDKMNGFVIIDYQPGKYRVTIKRLSSISQMPTPTLLGTYLPKGTITNLENYAFRKSKKHAGDYTSSFIEIQSLIWNHTILSLFAFKDKPITTDKW